MRVFVAGGTGVVGRRLVPQFVARGHRVTATTTSPSKLGLLKQLGAEAVVMDGLDAASVGEAVAAARPDAIVHQMTALAGTPDIKHMDRWFAQTIRLRTEGTDHLLAAAEATGVPHVTAQSYAGWNGIRRGARSVIAPSSGENMKMSAMEMAVMIPYVASARVAPTWSRTQREK